MLRTSSYTIYVDLPDNPREMLLVHGYTGAYDKVSRRVASYLRSRESHRPPKPLYGEWSPEPEVDEPAGPPPPDVIAVLRQRGYLTHLSPAEEETLFERLALKLHQRASARPPTYVFMPTYDCNLRCSYCFQDRMRTDPRFAHLLRTLRPAMVDRIFAAVPRIEAAHGVDPAAGGSRSVGFFGGEPLLAAQRPIVEYVIERSRRLGDVTFWAVTNATELEAYRDLLGPGALARLQVTLDGPPAEHDRRRVYADGSGSFARIARNLDLALERGAVVNVRLNVDRNNLHQLPAVARAILDRGWPRRRSFSVYAAPIHAANDKTPRRTTLNSWQLDQALVAMRRDHPEMRVIGRPDEGIRIRARQIFDRGADVVPHFRPSFCGAHDQMYIFDPFGDVYACWERTGEPQIRIARITPEGEVELRHDVHRQWRSRSVASNPVCRRCRYALHCGGGCAILALGQRGEFHANYCDGFASRFRASIADAYLAYLAGGEPGGEPDRLCDL
ncbi:MAG: radical SAM protein [Acidobacteria bacterium]|nr:MAG: radical SAM protein [Acidobacteriota bacterium]